jgi:hypothetical protein
MLNSSMANSTSYLQLPNSSIRHGDAAAVSIPSRIPRRESAQIAMLDPVHDGHWEFYKPQTAKDCL